jgi:hypothetical protein
MNDFGALETWELLAVGRRAFELEARRLGEIAAASESTDQPLRDLLYRMAQECELFAAEIDRLEASRPAGADVRSLPANGQQLIRGYLRTLTKSFGEGPLFRDAALFFAESLEEETSRLCRVLAEHARVWAVNRLFVDLAEREGKNVHFLREVVLAG